MPVEQRVWFVTGASGGFGQAITEAALEAGECVVATARRVEALAYLSEKYPPSRLLVQKLDVASNSEIDSAFDNMIKHFGRVDVVVNNAGYAIFGEVEGIPEADARKEFDVQFWGPVHICKKTAATAREVNPKGSRVTIFNISSAGGYNANPGISFYSASKFALEGFTESFSKELASEWGIRCCIIEPGGFETGWFGAGITVPVHPAYEAKASPFRSLRSSIVMLGDPVKAASAILNLSHQDQLPMRVQLGSDSLAIVQAKAKKVLKDSEEHAELARSTDKDGMDGKAYGEMIIRRL
ncbi:NAD(P)-binding protein [Agrocybe pediades]|nr:NAD(P)-binding protein [Agrocybe pediades]